MIFLQKYSYYVLSKKILLLCIGVFIITINIKYKMLHRE